MPLQQCQTISVPAMGKHSEIQYVFSVVFGGRSGQPEPETVLGVCFTPTA